MQIDEFEHALKKLCLFFGRKLTDQQMDIWYEKCRFTEFRDFRAGIESAISDERQFPTPNILLGYVDKSRGGRRFEENKKINQEAKRFFDPESSSSRLAKECIAMICQAVEQKGSGMQMVDGMLKLAEKYPHAGFKDQARVLATELLDKEGKLEKSI